MKTLLLVLFVLAVIVAGALFVYFTLPDNAELDAGGRVVVHTETLTCTDGTVLQTEFLEDESLVLTLNDTPYELTPAVAASGARYTNSDESFVFWNKGAESMVLVDNEVMFEGCTSGEVAVEEENGEELIRLTTPTADAVIESPLTIEGEARGQWYFEATFPIILTDWDGLIIAEGFATAQDEWMTTNFVPFTAELEFTSPYTEGDPDFMKRGSLILQKANASGLPEHDDALEITVWFAE